MRCAEDTCLLELTSDDYYLRTIFFMFNLDRYLTTPIITFHIFLYIVDFNLKYKLFLKKWWKLRNSSEPFGIACDLSIHYSRVMGENKLAFTCSTYLTLNFPACTTGPSAVVRGITERFGHKNHKVVRGSPKDSATRITDHQVCGNNVLV